MKKCVNTRARAFKITNTKKETPTYRRRAPPRPLPLRSVPPVFNQSARVLFDKREREFCVSERVQLLKPREREKKFTNFYATTHHPSVRAYSRERSSSRREFIFDAVAPKLYSRVRLSYLVLDFFLFLVGHFLYACVVWRNARFI